MIEASKFRFVRESETQEPTPVQELLRDSIDRLPELVGLPPSIDIGGDFPFMEEAIADTGSVRQQSLKEVLADLRALEDEHEKEFAATVVARGDSLVLGPYIEGERESVVVSAPLRETERLTASGLYICEVDSIVAKMHSHRVDATFSITDLFSAMGAGNEAVRQSYIVRENGGIDLVVRTEESRAFGKETFEQLAGLWNQFEGQFNSRAVAHNNTEWLQERNDYIMRVIVEQLKLGFYTNHGSENSAVLTRVVSE